MEMPIVKPGDRIKLGVGIIPKNAVVCTVYADVVPELIAGSGDIEVVYLDDSDKAINTGAIWNEDHWEFKHSGPSGGYADKYERLSEFVRILRSPRW